jgi:hypothetical protein
MRYHVRARLKEGRGWALRQAIEHRSFGRGSVAGGEYLRNMRQARLMPDESVEWVEVCYCATPLEEERPYWEAFFDLLIVSDAHDRRSCKHESGKEYWACSDCTCSRKLEDALERQGISFLLSVMQEPRSTR